MFSTALCRARNLVPLTALGAIVGGMLAFSPAAHADPTSFDPKSSVVVTRLPLVGNAGRIPVQVQIGYDRVIGFDVVIPAGGGRWTGQRDTYIPQLGIHCIARPGAALHYTCGSDDVFNENLPSHALRGGSYLLSLPAQRTGSYAGLGGTTTMYKLDGSGESFGQPSDTFPVVNGSTGPRSNAEVRNLASTDYADGRPLTSNLAVTVTVVGGESKTMALDVVLPNPELAWTLHAVKGGGHLTCAQTGPQTVHCTNTVAGSELPFPKGVFTAVLKLTSTGEQTMNSPGTVALSYADGGVQLPDTFDYYVSQNY